VSGFAPHGELPHGVLPAADQDAEIAVAPPLVKGAAGRDWIILLEIDAIQKTVTDT
jgi:hypothetical protein